MTAPLKIDKLLTLLDGISPFARAEAWDNVGLMVGDPDREVRGILLALDPTEALLEEARARHCDTISYTLLTGVLPR
ncbi:MAG: Nif3-like dinuclear metal center hexameric protein, partial [Desulfurivibrio sp.]